MDGILEYLKGLLNSLGVTGEMKEPDGKPENPQPGQELENMWYRIDIDTFFPRIQLTGRS